MSITKEEIIEYKNLYWLRENCIIECFKKFSSFRYYSPVDLIKIIQSYEECIICNDFYPIIEKNLKFKSASSQTVNINDNIGFNFSNYICYNLRQLQQKQMNHLHKNDINNINDKDSKTMIRVSIQQNSNSLNEIYCDARAVKFDIEIKDFIHNLIHKTPLQYMHKLKYKHTNRDSDYRKCEVQNEVEDLTEDQEFNHSWLISLHWEILNSRLLYHLKKGDQDALSNAKCDQYCLKLYKSYLSSTTFQTIKNYLKHSFPTDYENLIKHKNDSDYNCNYEDSDEDHHDDDDDDNDHENNDDNIDDNEDYEDGQDVGNDEVNEYDENISDTFSMIETKDVKVKKHIVLDLDGTLIDESSTPEGRPHLKEFLKFVLTDPRIDSVRIWTNASRQWWDEQHSEIISECIPVNCKFEEVWTSSDSISKHFVYKYCHEKQTTLLVKPLRKYWKRKKTGMTRQNTLIVDNTPETYMLNYGNAVPISTYVGDSKDTELLRVMKTLDQILNLDDVRHRPTIKYCSIVKR